jgi:2-polyprenyl-6-hydroxyphenyl methylase/3-demethylubiquinone-9 3-methyltransferase
VINNEFYKDLGESWFTAQGDVVALLRLENETKAPWVIDKLAAAVPAGARVLDVGCGGGFLTLKLAAAGYRVTGLDVAESVMASGRARDPRGEVEWRVGDATALPLEDARYDAVCMMDVLEHVEDWPAAIREVTRVLKPDGVFVFHTFNRTPLAWLFAARGLEWFLADTPAHVHLWRMFIKPRELAAELKRHGFRVREWSGIQPRLWTKAFLKLLFTRRVPADFGFRVGGGKQIGYLGVAERA